jgi:hypothetical protein
MVDDRLRKGGTGRSTKLLEERRFAGASQARTAMVSDRTEQE